VKAGAFLPTVSSAMRFLLGYNSYS
jgi:hypothetical protein